MSDRDGVLGPYSIEVHNLAHVFGGHWDAPLGSVRLAYDHCVSCNDALRTAHLILASDWLARVKAEAKAEALREAVCDLEPMNGCVALEVSTAHSKSHVAANAVRWLRDRAALLGPTTPTPTERDQG